MSVKTRKVALSEIEKEIAALYGKFGKDNQLTYAEARKLIRGKEFSEWRMTLKEYVSKSHTDSKILRELNTLAMRSRISRLEKLYTDTLIEMQNLGENSEKVVTDFLTTAYKERYYRGTYDLAKVGKLEIPVAAVRPRQLEKVLSSRWAGGNYSSRIWANTEKLSGVIKETITAGLHRGLSIPKLSKMVDSKMSAGVRNAERLVRTEMNFVQNHAAKESLQAAGLDEYEFIAVLDHRTTPRCQALDGTFHLLSEYSPGTNAPPMHPRCRSTIAAVLGEKTGKRIARNSKGENIQVPATMTYPDYKKVYLDRSMTLEQWHEKDKIRVAAEKEKFKGQERRGADIARRLANGEKVTPKRLINSGNNGNIQNIIGLSAGKQNDSNFKGTPPKQIGKLNDLSSANIKRTLEYFEKQIVTKTVEHAMIITSIGAIYHCSGELNGIAMEYFEELGQKLNGAIVTHNHLIGSDNEYTFSNSDFSLFEKFKLAVLRGIDEKFVYELNRNANDIDEINWSDLENEQKDRHISVLLVAAEKKYGYRRWRRG